MIDKSELESLSDFLFKEAERTANSVIFDVDLMSGERRAAWPKGESNRRQAEVYAVNEAADAAGKPDYGRRKVRRCKVCKDGKHSVDECPKFKRESIENRWAWLQKLELCFGCLSAGHKVRSCRTKERCSKCDWHHHSLISCPSKQLRQEKSKNDNYSSSRPALNHSGSTHSSA